MEARIFFRWNDSTDLKFHHIYTTMQVTLKFEAKCNRFKKYTEISPDGFFNKI